MQLISWSLKDKFVQLGLVATDLQHVGRVGFDSRFGFVVLLPVCEAAEPFYQDGCQTNQYGLTNFWRSMGC